MKALFITNRWPDPLNEFRHGTALRMRLMLKAIHAAGLSIDLLAYAPPGVQPDQSTETRLREDFLRLWGVEVVRLFLHCQRQSAASTNRASRFIRHLCGPSLVPAINSRK